MTTQSLQYSYSGADCDVFAIRGNDIKQLKSVATVSVSVYDAKAPVRALGHRSVKGYTGSIRTVAGSIVFIVVEGHPLEDLMHKNSGRYHADLNDLQVERLPNKRVSNSYAVGGILPFNLMLMYKNEIGNSAGLEIDNLEFVSEGIVTSVNDMVTEVVVQFVATDFRQLTRAKKDENQLKSLSSTLEAPEELVRKILIDLGYSPDDVYNLSPDVINKIEKHLLELKTKELESDIEEEDFMQRQIQKQIESQNQVKSYYANQKKRAEEIDKRFYKIDREMYDYFKGLGLEKRSEDLNKEMQFNEAQRRREQELRDRALTRDSIVRRNREVDVRRLSALEAQDRRASEFYNSEMPRMQEKLRQQMAEEREMQREVDRLTPSLPLRNSHYVDNGYLDKLKRAVEERKKQEAYENEVLKYLR